MNVTRRFLSIVRPVIANYRRVPTMPQNILSQLALNNTETEIKNLLVEFCNHHNVSDPKPLELRITGGWVRDKLLGLESNDIDIAINNMSGEEFVSKLHGYLRDYKQDLSLHAIHTIKKNPEKSKHLETCTTKLFGMDIDFVNLRSEEYTSESRVPIIKYGTAEEDAFRRDATLNALFYNLNKECIEDFTGKGMDDLRNGILRTPLQPLQTFLDDPLRVLRLIRFASRLNCIIEENTLDAMANPDLKTTLMYKISRERVGTELEKIFTSRNPGYGLQLINYAGLTDSIFTVGDIMESIVELNEQETLQRFEVSNKLIQPQVSRATYLFPLFVKYIQSQSGSKIHQIWEKFINSGDYQKAFWLATILAPYKALSVITNQKKGWVSHFPELLLRNGLKASKNEMETVSALVKNVDPSIDIIHQTLADSSLVSRSKLGFYLRTFGGFSDLNLLFVCFSAILDSVGTVENSQPFPEVVYGEGDQQKLLEIIEHNVSRYNEFVAYIESQDLTEVHKMRPLIDGKTLSKELSLKPGPWMGQVNNEIMVWQLDHPNEGKDQCLTYIKQILPNYL